MKKNALITALVVLLLVAGMIILQLWPKTSSVEKTSAPVVTKVAAPAPEPPALVPASLPVSTPAPVAPMSKVDEKLSKLHFGLSSDVQPINVVK
ncbi:MAG: hypothetical protein WCV68_00110 [Candidatus Paceibacterota bacterium]|jgi:hypothetical protein